MVQSATSEESSRTELQENDELREPFSSDGRDSIFTKGEVKSISSSKFSWLNSVLLEICQKGSIPLDLEQARPHLSTEVITDTAFYWLNAFEMFDKYNWIAFVVQVGDADEELCKQNIFEYVQGLDLKVFSCLHRLLEEALWFRDFKALL